MEINSDTLKWMDERIERLEKNNYIYKFACFVIGRRKKKLSYKEMYLILRTINEKNLGRELSDKRSFEEILRIYKYNNNRLPNEDVK